MLLQFCNFQVGWRVGGSGWLDPGPRASMTTSAPEPDFTSDDLTGGFPGDEEEKVAEVGEGVQQPGEAEKEEEVLEQQQQQKQQEQQQQQQPQQAVGESQCESGM